MCFGLPGVFNVVTGNGAFGQSLAVHPRVDKIGFTGSTQVRRIKLHAGLFVVRHVYAPLP